uniref:Uncharacterized protein n=1 Tax=Solanum lycopersicum TaxID=4081 RepID=A0A3Q7HBI9_SOLLC
MAWSNTKFLKYIHLEVKNALRFSFWVSQNPLMLCLWSDHCFSVCYLNRCSKRDVRVKLRIIKHQKWASRTSKITSSISGIHWLLNVKMDHFLNLILSQTSPISASHCFRGFFDTQNLDNLHQINKLEKQKIPRNT